MQAPFGQAHNDEAFALHPIAIPRSISGSRRVRPRTVER